jgi:hypothetical protein
MRPEPLALGVGVVFAMVPSAVRAQDVLLRFAPDPGLQVHAVWYFDVSSTLQEAGVPVLATEGAGGRSVTYRVVEQGASTALVEVTADSLRFRWRPDGAPWQTIADTGGVRPATRIRVDERLRAQSQTLTGQFTPRLRTALLAFAGGFEAPLPEVPVRRGTEWTSDAVFPWVEPTGLEDEPGIGDWIERAGPMIARATFRVDSVVDRGTDTLAYVGFEGQFLPATMAPAAEAADGRARVTGACSGKFIWSTGWRTWVSGSLAYTIRMAVREGIPDAEETAFTVVSEVTSRLQVRP